MSAQPSLIASTRLLSSQVLDPVADAILDLEHLDNETAQALQTHIELKEALNKTAQTENKTTSLDDIEALQNSLLSEDFDFSSLPSTASGPSVSSSVENSNTSNSSEGSFSSDNYIESLGDTFSNQANNTAGRSPSAGQNPGAEPPTSSTSPTNSEAEIDNSSKTLDTLNQSVTEDIRLVIEGQIDTSYQLKNASYETTYGHITVSSDGTWVYTLNNNTESIQSLCANETIIDSINLPSTSGDSYTLNITIHGANDNATISGDTEGEISTLSNTASEDTPESIQGKLSVTDTDSDESHFYSEETIEGTYGQMQISESGEWSYTLNHDSDAVMGLHSSDTLFDLLPIKSADGSNQLIKITIHGADDSPFLTGDNLETIDLAHSLFAEQTITVDDPDFGQSHFVAEQQITSNSNYGTGSIDEHGNWRYELNTDSLLIHLMWKPSMEQARRSS
jgi:VCBS repeat-containing protein